MLSFSILRVVLPIALGLGLLGCQESDYSKEYLLTHPDVLGDQVDSCRIRNREEFQQTPPCLRIIKIRNEFIKYLRARKLESAKLGKYILQSEMSSAKIHLDIQALQKTLVDLKNKNASIDKISQIQAKVDKLQKEYNATQQEIAIILAAISLDGP